VNCVPCPMSSNETILTVGVQHNGPCIIVAARTALEW
jgi:hypothetical protein